MKKTIVGFILCIMVAIGCAFLYKPVLNHINYGLDLQGGFEVLYEVEPFEGETLNSDMVYNTYKSILKRVDSLGVSEPEISIEGENRIRIRLAGVTSQKEAREKISSMYVLSFRDAGDNLLMTSNVLKGNAKVTQDSYGKPAVSLSIKDTDTFSKVTGEISKKMNNLIVIWLDYDENKDSYSKEKNKCGTAESRCKSAARVEQAFSSDVIIQGNFTKEEAETLAENINLGSLPTKLTELSSRTVEASFGTNSLSKTLVAGIIGITLVIILMTLVYHFAGIIAGVGVLLYGLLTFLVFYLINGVLTLPGIAAMLLGIGMAVDASVISFERIKDKLKIGVPLKKAFKEGNKTSMKSILDANITTIIVAIILFIFGESSVKGYATLLIISILVTLFIMLVVVRWILKYFVNTGYFDNKPRLFINVNKKKIIKSKEVLIPFKKLDFVKVKNKMFTLTILVIAVGAIFTGIKKLNLAVDFSGGTSITVNTTDRKVVNNIKSDLKESKYNIIKTSSEKDGYNIVIDNTLDKDSINKLTTNINDKYKLNSDIYVVSNVVKKELLKNAIISLVLASIGICIYVSLRFKFDYAISGIIALLHDVVITICFFSIFRLEIDTIFIAAILTIIGYSINDTIVTFDMIRERYSSKYKNNVKKDEDLNDLVNDSVRLTLFRSLMTTLTTIMPVICLIIFGASEIINFNIALLVGFISGVYSSIFISNPLWLILEKRKINKPDKTNNDEDDGPEELQVKGINC